ncbi:glycosyltransferase family 4 protein [Methanocella sp. MCL-LM]|uniref:glycosyltransferase family 4 protein n=1 Tax=Methanocella sp. MCL-LM TaxID=3412035 RepID=UPI003C72EE9F
MGRKKVAIVVQRYGSEVLGGSESLARSLAHLLSDVYDIDVLTTCAKDYVTWKNEFQAGESMDGPVRVLRFAVDRQRSKWFNLYNALMLKVPHTRWMEELWMSMQGPYSTGMFHFIKSNTDKYHLFVFFTYMYGTTYYGIKDVYAKSILLPTAHDEPYMRFGLYGELFKSVRKIIFLTREEKNFVDDLFDLDNDKGVVIGAPVSNCNGDMGQFRKKYRIEGDFILYVGRIDVMKGVNRLVEYFERYCKERRPDLKLVLCGNGPLKVPRTDHILPIGFVLESEKFGAMKAAIATVLPSKFESYSIVAMESMLSGTPVIVDGDCAVLKGHCQRGEGGICYVSYEEFAKALERLTADREYRKQVGARGQMYVEVCYSAEVIRKRYISTMDGLIS